MGFKEYINEKIENPSNEYVNGIVLNIKGLKLEIAVPDDEDFDPYIKVNGKEYEVDPAEFSKFVKAVGNYK